MEKIIFLDIDGVLNCHQTFKDKKEERILYSKTLENSIENSVRISLCDIDFEKIELLKLIVEHTGAKIVISSSWRNLRYYSFIEEALIKKGLPIIDETPYLNNNRGDEIREYLRNHQVDRFIILDDDIFPDFNELENYLIKTDFYVDGLNEEKAREAINTLGVKCLKRL